MFLNIGLISFIVILSTLQAVSCAKSDNVVTVFYFSIVVSKGKWNKASWAFGFTLDLVAITCLVLLVVSLSTIYKKVKQETQIILGSEDKESALEVILNTKQIRTHVITIVVLAWALVSNFIITIIASNNAKNMTLFNASYYVLLITWIMQMIVCFNFCRIFLYTSIIKDEEVNVLLNSYGQLMI